MNQTEEIKIEGIRETARKELEELELERISKIKELEQIKRELEKFEKLEIERIARKIKLNELAKFVNIRIIKESEKYYIF